MFSRTAKTFEKMFFRVTTVSTTLSPTAPALQATAATTTQCCGKGGCGVSDGERDSSVTDGGKG